MRKFAVQSMVLLLLDPKVMIGQGLLTIADVLCAACWITGEYASFLEGITDVDEDDEDDEREDAQQRHRARIRAIPTADLCFKLVDALTHPRVTNLPAYVQNVYLLNALKVFVHACKHAPPDDTSSLPSQYRDDGPASRGARARGPRALWYTLGYSLLSPTQDTCTISGF